MSKCIKCGQDIMATSPTLDTHLGDAHLNCPIPYSTTVTTADVADELNKWNLDGRARPFDIATRSIEYQNHPEPSLSLLIVDFGDGCAIKWENGSFYMDMLSVNETHPIDTTLMDFDTLRQKINAHFAEGKPIPRLEPIGKQIGFYPYVTSPQTTSFWFSQNDMNALNELARAAGATKDLPIYESQAKGEWTRVCAVDADGVVAIWRYTHE